MLFGYENVFWQDAPSRSGREISVAISLYNYDAYIVECLDSVVKQTYSELDLIIVDDVSKDASIDTVLKWLRLNAKRFGNILVVRHRLNSGLAEARNTAFSICKTAAVFVLDADNFIYPRAIERLSDALTQGDYGAAYCQLERFGDIRALAWSDIWSKTHFRRGNYVDAMALIKVDAWRRVGGYSQMEGWEDYDLWCKFVDHDIEGLFVPEILCRYRVHASSMLRTETVRADLDVKVKMTLRHPWLNL